MSKGPGKKTKKSKVAASKAAATETAPEDTTTPDQRGYYHSLRYLLAEAERPRDVLEMKREINLLRPKALRAAKRRRVPWDQWQEDQEEILVHLVDLLYSYKPEALSEATP